MSTQGPRRDLGAITVHMIGNAHIDPVWQWRWEEGRQEVLDTCRAALDRIRETPGFIFCRSSAVTPSRARSRITLSSQRPVSRKKSSITAPSK